MQLLRGLTKRVHSLAISPDSRFVVGAVAMRGGCHVWDLHDAKPKPRPLTTVGNFSSFRFPSLTCLLAKVSDAWWRYDLVAGTQSEVAFPRKVQPHTAVAHPSGELFKADSSDWRRIVTLRVAGGALEAVGPGTIAPKFPVLDAFLPDGSQYLVRENYLSGSQRRCYLRDTVTDQIVTTFVRPKNCELGHNDLWHFAPDGRRVFVVSDDHVLVYDCDAGGPPVLEFAMPRGGEWGALAVQPDGRRVATIEDDRAVTLRDAETLEVLRSYDFEMPKLTCVAFTPDGTRCVIGNGRGKVLLFDLD